jgi:hypothetical protein
MQIRQGDVLLHPIDSIPEDAILVRGEKVIVLAEGEATGHAHTIRASRKVKAMRKDAELYLEVSEPVTLEHQEHAAIEIQPGTYHVRRQLEFWYDEVRPVID